MAEAGALRNQMTCFEFVCVGRQWRRSPCGAKEFGSHTIEFDVKRSVINASLTYPATAGRRLHFGRGDLLARYLPGKVDLQGSCVVPMMLRWVACS